MFEIAKFWDSLLVPVDIGTIPFLEIDIKLGTCTGDSTLQIALPIFHPIMGTHTAN
jgi:hypothetical protein